jgi:Tfp pilus assembly protein FimT
MNHRFPIQKLRAFTLVEMLVATTVTLLLVFAITQAFATVSVTIRNTRASVEMAGQLRGVALRLQQDLEGVTANTKPWVHASWGRGYFEYFDGPCSDADSNGDSFYDTDKSVAAPNPSQANVDQSFGDTDDVLMFTARSESDPFAGRNGTTATTSMIQSNVAEIVWWLRPGQAGKYMLYRRALMVRPDLNTLSAGVASGVAYPAHVAKLFIGGKGYYDVSNASPDHAVMAQDVIEFYDKSDLSVHFFRHEVGNQVVLYAVANSINDLTIRENRFCHDPIVFNGAYVRAAVPPTRSTVYPHPIFHINTAALSLQNVVHDLDRNNNLVDAQGEDVMLGNMLAWDVRAFDPLALVTATQGIDNAWGMVNSDDNGVGGQDEMAEAGWIGTDDEASTPGDQNFTVQITPLPPPLPSLPLPYPAGPPQTAKRDNIIGLGAFVDLNYFGKYDSTKYPLARWPPDLAHSFYFESDPYFEDAPQTKSALAAGRSGTYDTWPFDYESDGINQDNDFYPNSGNPPVPYLDEGTNGVDEDLPNPNPPNPDPPGYGRVDDETEHETSPPYLYPLKAIQIRLRVIDPDTRQIRQTAVVSHFSD